MLFNIFWNFIFINSIFWCFMSILNHGNEGNGKRWIVFVYIKRNFGTVSWLQHATVKFSDGPDWTEGKQAVWNILMTGDLNALGCRFSLRDKGKAVCGEGGCQWEGEGKTGLGCCVWLVYKKCMKFLVVVYEDFAVI